MNKGTTAPSRSEKFLEVWHNPSGLRSLTIVSHSAIGMRYMITGSLFFLVGGLLALLLRTQLALPEQNILSPEVYNQFFTMHGTVMMFLFAVPMLEGLAVYLIPKMIGARDLVFPRLSSFSYFCYLFGGLILMFSLVLGLAPNTGWFMYTPLTNATYSPGPNADFWLLGVTLAEVSAVAAGVELVVSIMRTRTAKMSLNNMPLFCWYILVMALMILFGFPPLILGSILLELERAANMPFFDPLRGGDPILWQHLFWLFGHPEVYIIFLPAAGIVSTIIPVFARRPIVGYNWIVMAVITTGFISFGLWVHHMFTVGIPQLAMAFFSAASMLVAIPTGIQIFAWIATLWGSQPRFAIPMLWVSGFLVNFLIGGFTGVMLALVPFDWQVHDTHFVVAHLHYVLVGGMFFPLIAGLYYWLPLFSGRMPSERMSKLGFWLTFIGFNLTFLIMHFTGLLGMPRRVYTYEGNLGWDIPNLISSVGAFVFALGVVMVILDIITHFRIGAPAGSNPWKADTLEWASDYPPENYNFLSLPESPTRHPLWKNSKLKEEIAAGEFSLANANSGLRETWGSDPVTAKLREVIILPTNSWLPLQSALMLTFLCISLLVRIYPLAVFFALLALISFFRWGWENGLVLLKKSRVKITSTADFPLHPYTADGPGIWGMAVSLLADASIFMALLFGWLYIWIVVPKQLVPLSSPLSGVSFLSSGLLLTFAAHLYLRMNKNLDQSTQRLESRLWIVAVFTLVHCFALAIIFYRAHLKPTLLAHDAVITALLLYLAIHSFLALLMTVQLALRSRWQLIGDKATTELIVVKEFWIYTLTVFWISFAALILLPMSLGT